MATDKKLAAAATHTAEQARLAWLAVDNAKAKVERSQEHLEAAEDALERLQEQAEAAQQLADNAREAASGLDVFVDAQAAHIGMER